MKDRPGMNTPRWLQIQGDRTWANAHPVSDEVLPEPVQVSLLDWDEEIDGYWNYEWAGYGR